MVTNMRDYVTLDPEEDDADFRYGYRDTMIAQFKQDFYNKTSVFRINVKVIKMILSRTELNFGLLLLMIYWMIAVPIPDDFFIYDYNDDGLDHSVRGAEIFPEIRENKKSGYTQM